jgi:hypothetical protein
VEGDRETPVLHRRGRVVRRDVDRHDWRVEGVGDGPYVVLSPVFPSDPLLSSDVYSTEGLF